MSAFAGRSGTFAAIALTLTSTMCARFAEKVMAVLSSGQVSEPWSLHRLKTGSSETLS